MKAVGIKALKDNLSKYIRMVREGETILVTDRDEVVAEIHRPVRPVPAKIDAMEAFLNEEERRGSLIRAKPGRKTSLSKIRELPRPRVPIDLQKLLSEIKADR